MFPEPQPPVALPKSSLFRWNIVVMVRDARVRLRMRQCLDALRIRYENATLQQVRAGLPGRTLFCIGSAALETVPALPRPAVIISAGDTVSLPASLLQEVAAGDVVVVALSDLTPLSLLRALMIAAERRDLFQLKEALLSRPRLSSAPQPVVEAFLLHADGLMRLRDLARALKISRKRARLTVREAGFKRAEHLFAALRAGAWAWFASRGLPRKVYETYLGIQSHSNFRRACRRARIPLPWAETPGPPAGD